jgi:hypothetical protein
VRTHALRGVHLQTHDSDGQTLLWPARVLGFLTIELLPGPVTASVDRVLHSLRRGLHRVG